ncbi:MAG TPA: SpoIID/LytB domain-containing protein [Acidimicrobiales bacterium]|nr:SpoIID/LytB domain-containing protein [Acidimicrobiales bacterium]
MRRRLLALAVLAVLAPLPPARAAVPVLVVDGKGFGHGVGMAQDGAYWMGRSGATTAQILGQFYPGTKVAKASSEVRVVVLPASPDGTVIVAFPNGGEVRDARSGAQSAGFPVQVPPGGQVRLHGDGTRYWVEGGQAQGQAQGGQPQAQAQAQGGWNQPADPTVRAAQLPTTTTTDVPTTTTTSMPTTSTTSTTQPPSTTTSTTAPEPPPSSPPPPPQPSGPTTSRSLWAVPSGSGTVAVPARDRRYRGVVEATAAGGPFRLVNQVDVEQYLRGMGEVRDPRWPAASLRAQAIAARTYALRATAAGNELCDDTHCQVYLGAQVEYAAMDKAVSDTRGQVLTFGKGLASTVYSANGGAYSASRTEGFGTPDDGGYPYLRPAPYPTQDPSPWTVRIGMGDVAARLGYPAGQLAGAAVSRMGPSGRVLEVRLDGGAGPRTVTGLAFAKAFALRSTLFTVAAGSADAAPPPPPSGDIIQALPEQAGATYDPNALPPVPLASELAAKTVPTLPTGPTDAVPPFRFAPVRPRAHDWPWVSLGAFAVLVLVATGGALVTLLRTRTAAGKRWLPW